MDDDVCVLTFKSFVSLLWLFAYCTDCLFSLGNEATPERNFLSGFPLFQKSRWFLQSGLQESVEVASVMCSGGHVTLTCQCFEKFPNIQVQSGGNVTLNAPSTERLLQGQARFASRELKWTQIDKLSVQSKGKGTEKKSSLLNFRKLSIFTYLHGPVLGHVPSSVDYRFWYCSNCDIPSVFVFSP